MAFGILETPLLALLIAAPKINTHLETLEKYGETAIVLEAPAPARPDGVAYMTYGDEVAILGFGKNSSMAVIERQEGTEVGDDGLSMQLQLVDLVTDQVALRVVAHEGMPVPSAREKTRKTLADRGIVPLEAGTTLQSLPATLEGKTVRAGIEGTELVLHVEGRGRKVLGTLDPEESRLTGSTKVVGVVQSPFEPRVVVVVRAGYRDMCMTEETRNIFLFFGAHLRTGFSPE